MDWICIILYLVLIGIGVASIYASKYDFDNTELLSFAKPSGRQVAWIGLALVIAVVLLLFDGRMYESCAYPIYIIILMALVVTIAIAGDIKGSRSWLVIGPVNLQPAEFGKFATSLALARLFASYNFSLSASRTNYLKALAIILIPVLLIIAQKETGSALAYLALFLVLYREGMSGSVLLAALGAVTIFVIAIKYSDTTFMDMPTGEAIVLMLVMAVMTGMLAIFCKDKKIARNVALWFIGTGLTAWLLHLFDIDLPGTIFFITAISIACIYCFFMGIKTRLNGIYPCVWTAIASVAFLFMVNFVFTEVLQEHHQKRICVLLGLEEDLLGTGYNVNQAKIAIGSGGLSGKGFLNGTQTKLDYVPEQHTDFIYCTIGEEQGFLGSVAVLIIFLLLILRVIHIAERQPSVFGRVYGYCVASFFILHLTINIGMVIGLCPVIGIPLPFVSYGGSSLWGFTILLFILLSIDASRRSHPAYF
ncbi:MAG: rod shape-determining protein RodA [Paramuribaculum sp.]|nr:rod shape-determining protein RodA [Paramuribaculum sp.]